MSKNTRSGPQLSPSDRAYLEKMEREGKGGQLSLVPPPEFSPVAVPRIIDSLAEARLHSREFPDVWGNSDVGFYPSSLCQMVLPAKSRPGSEYKYENGKYMLSVLTPGRYGLPFGPYARGILNYTCTQIVHKKKLGLPDPRVITLGKGLTEFMERLSGKRQTSGGAGSPRESLRRQIRSLLNSTINWSVPTKNGMRYGNMNISSVAEEEMMWKPQLVGGDAECGGDVTLLVDEVFYNDVTAHAVPVNDVVLKSLWPNCFYMDLYVWLTYKANVYVERGGFALRWENVIKQFAHGYSDSSLRSFKKKFRKAFNVVRAAYDPLDPECIKLNESGENLWFTVRRRSVPTVADLLKFDRRRTSLPAPALTISTATRPKAPQVDQSLLPGLASEPDTVDPDFVLDVDDLLAAAALQSPDSVMLTTEQLVAKLGIDEYWLKKLNAYLGRHITGDELTVAYALYLENWTIPAIGEKLRSA